MSRLEQLVDGPGPQVVLAGALIPSMQWTLIAVLSALLVWFCYGWATDRGQRRVTALRVLYACVLVSLIACLLHGMLWPQASPPPEASHAS